MLATSTTTTTSHRNDAFVIWVTISTATWLIIENPDLFRKENDILYLYPISRIYRDVLLRTTNQLKVETVSCRMTKKMQTIRLIIC